MCCHDVSLTYRGVSPCRVGKLFFLLARQTTKLSPPHKHTWIKQRKPPKRKIGCQGNGHRASNFALKNAIDLTIPGKIQTVIEETESEKTPLAQKLDDFGHQLSKVTDAKVTCASGGRPRDMVTSWFP